MAESNGHLCPECGAPRGADNTPSCGCTERASEALRDARTAEAAAAEDFDPLRIRPYVELDRAPEGAGAVGAGAVQEPPPAADDTTELPAVEATMALRAVAPDVTAALPTPLAPPANAPSAADLSLFEEDAAPVGEGPRRGRRRTALLGVSGALVTVVAAAGFASGLFTYESPSRDEAPPENVRAAVPDASTSAASVSPSTESRSAEPTSAAPSPSVSASPSPSASPSASASSGSPSPSRSAAEPTASGATTSAGGSDNSRETTPPVLRRGSEGAEVTELELRLTQLGLYTRKASGNYNEGVEDAVSRYQWARGIQAEEYGVYDLVTRERLESETTEP